MPPQWCVDEHSSFRYENSVSDSQHFDHKYSVIGYNTLEKKGVYLINLEKSLRVYLEGNLTVWPIIKVTILIQLKEIYFSSKNATYSVAKASNRIREQWVTLSLYCQMTAPLTWH